MHTLVTVFLSLLHEHYFNIVGLEHLLNGIMSAILGALFYWLWYILRSESEKRRGEKKRSFRFRYLASIATLCGLLTPAIVELIFHNVIWYAYVLVNAIFTFSVDTLPEMTLSGLTKSGINIYSSIVHGDKITDDEIDPVLHSTRDDDDELFR